MQGTARIVLPFGDHQDRLMDVGWRQVFAVSPLPEFAMAAH